jgi:glutamate synthase domain-containing protein 1
VQGENLESNNAGSRTNLDGNIRILSREEEDKFSFDSFSDSCKYISKKCKQKGWDVVTFQNHTRIGSHEDRKRHESEIYEILSN